MNEQKRLEIKTLLDSRFEEDKTELCKEIMMGYIFGPYGTNEHYSIDEINSLWDELYLEKNPLPIVEEPIIEEPIVE